MRGAKCAAAALVLGASMAAGQPVAGPRAGERDTESTRLRASAPDGRVVELDLHRVSVVTGSTRFVVRSGGVDREIGYDPARVALFSGEVVGRPGSRAFVARTPSLGTIGWVADADGAWGLVDGLEGSTGLALAAPARAASRPAPLCGTDGSGWVEPAGPVDDLPADYLVEVAVDTDFDYYELFDHPEHALDYLVAMYGQVSYVYERDSGIRLTLSYVRIWTDPTDMFNGPDPLGDFRRFWNMNMDGVHRDVAQFCSGRRDFPFGGQAYLPGVCNLDRAYSVIGYVAGAGGDVDLPSHLNSDVVVAAHELGHNFGAPHTHDRELDECDDAFAPPRRGPIMSYCGQSYSGGDANHDPRFHTDSTRLMRTALAERDCDDADCNANAIADATDIAMGTSLDANGNGVPDECEDCNGNGKVDDQDILNGVSLDLNGNGTPDECEPDCDGNGVPDSLEIAMGAADEDANGVPDSCQVDCDGNGVADALDINADMSLDRDRNAVLDGCQDCDGDGINDLLALDHEWNIWVGSLEGDVGVREFYGATGVLMRATGAAGGAMINDVVITADTRVLLSSADGDRVIELDRDGQFVRDLVGAGSGGLDEPAGMLIAGDALLVASRQSGAVLEFDLATGVFVRALVEAVPMPFGLAPGPGGGLLVSAGDDQVYEFDIETGVARRIVVDASDNGGLSDPRGLVVDTLGRLLVCSRGGGAVLSYDLATGAPTGTFNRNGTVDRLTLEEPWGIRVGPNRNVFVSNNHIHLRSPPELHLTQARIYEFDYHFGNYVRSIVQGADTGLWHPTGFDFVPGGVIDCNMNFMPDLCEIAQGLAQDLNGDGVPDDCQACPPDLDGDRDVDSDDFFAYLDLFAAGDDAADLTGTSDPASRAYGVPDGEIDADDFFVYLDRFAAGC